MWAFGHDKRKQSSIWLLYGKIVSSTKYPDSERYEVFMQDELFYGEGAQVSDDGEEGWQHSDPKQCYTIFDDQIFNTQEEVQRYGIKALMSGRIF